MTNLRALVARVRDFYSPAREPLRRRVYTALLMVIGAAVTAGLVTGTVAVTLSGLLPVLLVVPAVEAARQKVTPVAAPVLPINDEPGQHALERLP